MDNISLHSCGGTILHGGLGTPLTSHKYCDRCQAFTYDLAGEVPSGTDRKANRRAYDRGEDESPEVE
jgi:hypothetical protein